MSGKIKYTKSFKIEAVKAVLEDNEGITSTSEELGVHKADLKKWISFYKEYGADGLAPKTIKTFYPGRFKLLVVRDIEQNKLSFRSASLKYNISSHTTVRAWYYTYLAEGAKGLVTEKRRGRSLSMNSKSKKSTRKPLSREEELLKENESLKAELALLKKLRALARARKKKQ